MLLRYYVDLLKFFCSSIWEIGWTDNGEPQEPKYNLKRPLTFDMEIGSQIILKHFMMRVNHNPSEALLLAMAWAPAGLFGLQFLEKNFLFDFLPWTIFLTLNSGCSSCCERWKLSHTISRPLGKEIRLAGEGPRSACKVLFHFYWLE